MKCPNCGADITHGKYCEYCGTAISGRMLKEQEELNKSGCPQCGSTNVSFTREKQGEYHGANGTAIIHATVGVCKDCGYTWETSSHTDMRDFANTVIEKPKKRRKVLWILGWIYIFPLPLTLILLKKEKLNPLVKYGVIIAAWIAYLAVIYAGQQ